jgi:hypothetical protein
VLWNEIHGCRWQAAARLEVAKERAWLAKVRTAINQHWAKADWEI